MSAGDRFKAWIESLSDAWKDRLRGWMVSWLDSGLRVFFESREPEIVNFTRSYLERVRDLPNIDPQLKELIDKSLQPGDIFSVIMGYLMTGFGAIFQFLSLGAPLGRTWEYMQDRILTSYRFDPVSVITAWRRDPEKYEYLFDDLRDKGFKEGHIEALKYLTQYWPTPQDLVNWSAKEVFEPDARRKYGLDDEFDKLDLSLFAGAGVSEDQALNYWRAHWQHTSFQQMIELLHRGLLSATGEVPTQPTTPEEWAARDAEGEAELYEWYRLVEIVPHWRDMLTASVWNVPTRVDVRRWWDMRVISEDELYSIYHRMGYHGRDAEIYVLWTKVYTEFPSLLARWSKGWITEDEVRATLVSMGMPADQVTKMIQEKIRPEVQQDVSDALDLTKSETYKGVKAGKITRDEGVEIIMRLGKNQATAEFLVDLNTEVITGSPENFDEFMSLADKYLKATGREVPTMPEALKAAADELKTRTDELEVLKADLKKYQDEIIDVQPYPDEVQKTLDTKQAAVANAELQLNYARTNYETELVKWRSTQ